MEFAAGFHKAMQDEFVAARSAVPRRIRNAPRTPREHGLQASRRQRKRGRDRPTRAPPIDNRCGQATVDRRMGWMAAERYFWRARIKSQSMSWSPDKCWTNC